jgi:hypothetical protein
MPTITTAAALRAAFWDAHPELDARARQRRTRSKGHNAQDTDTRLAWCDWIDAMHRAGHISDRLANTATL